MTQYRVHAPKKRPWLTRLFDYDLGAGLALLAVVVVSFSQMGHGVRDWVYPRALTYLIGIIALTLVIRWTVRVVKGARDDIPAGGKLAERQTAVDTGVVIMAALIYAVGMSVIGFWVTTFVVLGLLSAYLTERRNAKALAISVVVAAVVSIAGYFVFLHVFYVPVPMVLLGH